MQVSPAQSRMPYPGGCEDAVPLTALLVVLVFTKVAGFVPLKKLATAPQTACLLLQHVSHCHGLQDSMVMN